MNIRPDKHFVIVSIIENGRNFVFWWVYILFFKAKSGTIIIGIKALSVVIRTKFQNIQKIVSQFFDLQSNFEQMKRACSGQYNSAELQRCGK